MRCARWPLALLVVVCALGAGARAGELVEDDFRKLRAEIQPRMAKPGDPAEKVRLAHLLAGDDTERGAKLLVTWAVASSKLLRGELADRLARAEKGSAKEVEAVLRRSSAAKLPPDAERHFPELGAARRAEDAARRAVSDERSVLAAVESALGGLQSPEAVAHLAGAGGALLDRVERPEGLGLRLAVARTILRSARGAPGDPLRRWVELREEPEVRAALLETAGRETISWMGAVATAWLGDRSEFVKRAAARALERLDEPSCVDALIAALHTDSGLLADQVERTLFTYTGQRFAGDPVLWAAWRADQRKQAGDPVDGPAGDPPSRRRYPPEAWTEEPRGGSLYGHRIRSTRVVFVFDRSASMAEARNDPPPDPLAAQSAAADCAVAGATDFDIAQGYLLRAIESLPASAHVAVVFYGAAVDVFREPPELCRLDPKARREAVDWVRAIRPEGSTALFPALDRALDYALPAAPDEKRAGPRADTVYLLSDGSPTDPDGEIVRDPEREQLLLAFLARARATDCTVHTIGVGPYHARELMQRIARETGGVYVPVGE